MAKPDWFILIEQWKEKGMGVYGVTLPFIVGALAFKRGDQDLSAQYVRDVLDEIIKNPVEDYVTEISWCAELSAPVFHVSRIDAAHRASPSVSIPRPSGEGESLVFAPNICGGLGRWPSNDPEALLDRLIEDASEPVCKGRYSRIPHKKEYGDFGKGELAYIKNTIIASE